MSFFSRRQWNARSVRKTLAAAATNPDTTLVKVELLPALVGVSAIDQHVIDGAVLTATDVQNSSDVLICWLYGGDPDAGGEPVGPPFRLPLGQGSGMYQLYDVHLEMGKGRPVYLAMLSTKSSAEVVIYAEHHRERTNG